MERKSMKGVHSVCFTGHRQIPVEDAMRLPSIIRDTVIDLMERGATVFRTGGAMGFDTVAALVVLELQESYPQIELELILPCRNQTEKWDASSIRTYEYILARATRHTYLYERYVEGCMLARDRRLVEGSDVCVAYCTRSKGGTAYTCALALRSGLEFINLHDCLGEIFYDE